MLLGVASSLDESMSTELLVHVLNYVQIWLLLGWNMHGDGSRPSRV